MSFGAWQQKMTRREHFGGALLWGLVLLLAAWVYWPGLDGPYVFDDWSNLQEVAQARSVESALEVTLGNQSGPSGRPVSMASFAVQQLVSDAQPRQLKQVNLILHLLMGTLIYLWLQFVLAQAGMARQRLWAGVAAAIWLLSPLQVSTVLYPVQRMAQLAALFMLAALISYGYLRTTPSRSGRYGAAIGLAVSIPLALGSKENAVAVFAGLWLMEAILFRCRDQQGRTITWLRVGVVACLVAAVLAMLWVLLFPPGFIETGYQRRDFDLWERLLSQGRILWHYQMQLLWPDGTTLGVIHDDYSVSTSLVSPLATLWAWLAWLAVFASVALAVWMDRGRLYVFAVGLFVSGHAVESTFLPLELYFEHRNYFPAIAVVLLLAAGLSTLHRRWPQGRGVVFALCCLYLLGMAATTSSQVQVWRSQATMTLHTVAHHPQSARANITMAQFLAEQGALEEALLYSARVPQLRREQPGDAGVRALLFSCYAGRALGEAAFEALALWHAQGKLIAYPNALLFLTDRLVAGDCEALSLEEVANAFAMQLLERREQVTVDPSVYGALATLENQLQRYGRAQQYVGLGLQLEPDGVQLLLMQLHFATALDDAALAARTQQRLSMLRTQGKLNRQQQQTLALYTEG